ncbi:MAG: hypothetical protein JNL67_08510 [Planctomycetaceae bacterium]|nr:hypothetical protein [Planctomycetaceae bacterium]
MLKCLCFAMLACVLAGSFAEAQVRRDEVTLHSGHVLFGSVTKSGPQNAGELELLLEDGTKLILNRELYRSWKPEPAAMAEYRERLAQTTRTVESQWELAKWCEEQKLKPETDTHARIVIQLDPEHELARRALGHQRIRGRWEDPEEAKRAQGYVKIEGRWVDPDISEIEKLTQEYRTKQITWKKELNVLFKQATGSGRNRDEAARKILAIRDAEAVDSLVERLTQTKPDVTPLPQRAAILEVLCEIPTLSSSLALLDYYMTNADDQEGRDRAIQTLAQRAAHKPQVAKRLADQLDVDLLGNREKYTDESTVRENQVRLHRAATALRIIDVRIGIEALISSIRVPYTVTKKFRENAALSGDNVQSGGGTREVKQSIVEENKAAWETLEKFTGQKFANNQAAWLQWWIAENTPANLDLRRDQ